MKRVLKIILICILCLGLLGGGVFAYLKFRKVPPCEVYPAMQWMMSYMPNQTYLYGIVTSDASQIIAKSSERTVLEILVNPGDVVSVGDPLLRYDATRAQISYEESKLKLIKLENQLRAEYAEYKKYARAEYENPLLTPTPSPTPAVRRNSAANRSTGAVRLSVRYYADLNSAVGGSGSQSDPVLYERIVQPEAEIFIAAAPDGAFAFSVKVENDSGSADLNDPKSGNGSAADPLVYAYASGANVPNAFLALQSEKAAELLMDVVNTVYP